jgi:chemotaxis protein CheC
MELILPLNALELDALTELVNIGVSSAATSLREMVSEEIILSVPKIELLDRSKAVETLHGSEAGKLVAVHQVFDGEITGRVMLIFPEANSLEIVRAVAGSTLSLEDIMDLEHEALAETGNIILNGCLATIANMLERNLKMSLPEILRGEAANLFNLPPPPNGGSMVLFVYINFAIKTQDIKGYVALLMDMPSLAALQQLLGEFIERAAGGLSPDTIH